MNRLSSLVAVSALALTAIAAPAQAQISEDVSYEDIQTCVVVAATLMQVSKDAGEEADASNFESQLQALMLVAFVKGEEAGRNTDQVQADIGTRVEQRVTAYGENTDALVEDSMGCALGGMLTLPE